MSKFEENQLYKILVGGIGTRRVGNEDVGFDPYPELIGQVLIVDKVWDEQGLCIGTIVQGKNVGEKLGHWFTEKQLELVGSVKVEDNDSNL